MVYTILADLVVGLHVCFVIFVVLGAVLVLWKPHIAWFHIPAVFWGAGIEFLGWVCPLTPLENILRARGGDAPYATTFVEHYVMPVLYPTALDRNMQIGLGVIILGVNGIIYLFLLQKIRRAVTNQH